MNKHQTIQITYCTQKGGAGKTTLTMFTSIILSELGYKVGIVDLDEQQSASHWLNMLQQRGHEGIELKQPGEHYDFVFYDTPGSLGPKLLSALRQSDHALLVVNPSSLDYWSTERTIQFLHNNRIKAPVKLVFNMTDSRTEMTRQIGTMVKRFGVETMPVLVPDRQGYKKAVHKGMRAMTYSDRIALNKLVDRIKDLRHNSTVLP